MLNFKILLFFILFFNSVFADAKVVALTFDDGPHEQITTQLIEILDNYDVLATFFLVGKMMEEYPQLVREIYNSGSEIGNHTWSHRRLDTLTEKEIKEELTSVNVLLKNIIGKRTNFFRPPGGRLNEKVLDVVCGLGYKLVLWTRFVNDMSPNITAEKIFNNATNEPKEIELIMLHSGIKESMEALPLIIEFYKKKGYEFTTISRLAAGMYRNMDAAVKVRNYEFPIMLGDNNFFIANNILKLASGGDELKSEKMPVILIGAVAFFVSVGASSFYFKKAKKKKNKVVSLVFLGSGNCGIKEILQMLKKQKITATFFLTENDLLDKAEIEEIREHNVACLGNGQGVDDLKKWKNNLDMLNRQMLPLYYSAEGYNNTQINAITKEGFLPVDWRLPPLSGDSCKNILKRINGKLRQKQVIPLQTDSIQMDKVIPELIEFFTNKGYKFMPLKVWV